MSTDSYRLDALEQYNETMAARYGLRKVAPSELDDIAWDKWEVRAIEFPDGLAAVVARFARETTLSHTVAWVMPDGKLDVGYDAQEPPVAWNYAVVFSGLSHSVRNERHAIRFAKDSAQKARELRILRLCLRQQDGREMLSARHLEQVAWVFRYSVATIKEWRRLHRGRGTPGRPRNR